jgi:hypothetical protein
MPRVSATAKVGIALIVAPSLWFGGWVLWNGTRNWVPVRMPLSGKSGSVRTYEFKINVEGFYSIDLYRETQNVCAERLGVGWSLSMNGAILRTGKADLTRKPPWPQWPQPECAIGRFHAETGVYRLDVDGVDHPSLLMVYEDGGQVADSTDHGIHAFMALMVSVPIGLATLVVAIGTRRAEKRADATRRWTLTQPGSLSGAGVKLMGRPRPKRVLARSFLVSGRFNLNQHTASVVQVLMPLCVVVAVAIPMPWGPSHGFAIRTVLPGVKLLPAAGIMPLRIRILAGQSGYRWAPVRGLQIGSQIMDAAEFPAFVRHELAKRPSDWPVYIEADPDLEYEGVARTIDAVSSFGGKVILLTPGFKADLGEGLEWTH